MNIDRTAAEWIEEYGHEGAVRIAMNICETIQASASVAAVKDVCEHNQHREPERIKSFL